jgi:RNA polymerase sigma-70 factor (ECF subfamily)
MSTVDTRRDVEGVALAAARAGDRLAFGALAERHRAELRVHCYRMLGSLDDAEDLVQETFLRAWRRRTTFEGRSSFRAWLYGIATNASLDAIERARRRPPPPPGEITWLQPYPDRLLEQVAPSEDEPEAAIVSKETIELAFLAAIQHLPPTQRAVLVLRDVLGWSAKETAALLEASVASANSSLQRARATMRRHLPERRLEWAPGTDPSEAERELLKRYMDASERNDVAGLARMMSEDARFSMPPAPERYVGREAVVACWVEGGFGSEELGHVRCLPTRANRQPAVANYIRRPGEHAYRAMALDVLRVEDGAIVEIVAFPPAVYPAFGLPAELPQA